MIKLIGVPYDGNSSFLRGPANAPARIRLMETEGSANTFAEFGQDIQANRDFVDLGDIDFPKSNPQMVYETIKEKINNELSDGSKIVCLGGDHSISFPIIEAYTQHYQGLNVLHFDAHGDLYENFDDNPFSHASPFARILEKGQLASLTQVGIRTLSTHQKEQVTRYGVNVIEMKDFNLDFINGLKTPLYISLDLDVLDPAFAPGVSHHEPGGLSTREVLDIIHSIKVPIVGADIVEYNPVRDIHNMTAMVGYKFQKELMSKMID